MKTFAAIVGILALWVGVMAFVAWLVELLWNFVMVGTFHLPSLSFWTSLAFLLLVSLIFGAARGNSSVKKTS